jgi:hypothetical protein
VDYPLRTRLAVEAALGWSAEASGHQRADAYTRFGRVIPGRKIICRKSFLRLFDKGSFQISRQRLKQLA